MSGAGTALMGIGSAARGEGRSLKAAEIAINSPLLEASMEGAQGVLMSIAPAEATWACSRSTRPLRWCRSPRILTLTSSSAP